MASEHPDTAAHLCRGELGPLHSLVRLCGLVHGSSGDEEVVVSDFWAAAAVGRGVDGESRSGTADRADDQVHEQACFGLFSRAFRVLRNTAAHIGVQSSRAARRNSLASLGGIDRDGSNNNQKYISRAGRLSNGMNGGMSVLRRSSSGHSSSTNTGETYLTSRSGSSSSSSSSGSRGSKNIGGGSNPPNRGRASTSSSFFRDRRLHATQSSGGIVPILVNFVLGELQKSSEVCLQYRDFTGESCLEVVADFLFVLATCNQLRGKALFPELPVIAPSDVMDRNAFLTALALTNDAGGR